MFYSCDLLGTKLLVFNLCNVFKDMHPILFAQFS